MQKTRLIVDILPSKRTPLEVVRYTYRREALHSLSGSVPGCITGIPEEDSISVICRHHPSPPKVKHVVFSCDKSSPRDRAFSALAAVGPHFVDFFAPGADFLLPLHRDKAHPHGHLVLCNSDGFRAIEWKIKDTHLMQELVWIPERIRRDFDLEPGKNNGIGRGGTNHGVRKLAARLLALFPDDPVARAVEDELLAVESEYAFDGGRLLRSKKCRVAESTLLRHVEFIRLEGNILALQQATVTRDDLVLAQSQARLLAQAQERRIELELEPD